MEDDDFLYGNEAKDVKNGVNTEAVGIESNLSVDSDDNDESSDSDIEFVIETRDEKSSSDALSGLNMSSKEDESHIEDFSVVESNNNADKDESSANEEKSDSIKPEDVERLFHTDMPDENYSPVFNLDAPALIDGIPINEISLDDIPGDKPWRKPGAIPSDFFNYGFDEFTWTLYCDKLKKGVTPNSVGPGSNMGVSDMMVSLYLQVYILSNYVDYDDDAWYGYATNE